MEQLANRVATITGAASGIGRELAIVLADEGCHVALVDIDEIGVEETRDMIGNHAVRVTTHVCDVSNRDRVNDLAEDVVRHHGQLDIAINNAAVMVAESLEDVTYEDFEWVMGINFWGVVYCTKAFLPYLRLRPTAHLVNMSSINGILTTPNNGPYCIAKFAVTGFTETLIQELAGANVRVSCVLPGGVRTNIVRNTRFKKQANPALSREDSIEWFDRATLTSPAKAARTIVAGIKKNRSRILVGPDAYFLDLMKRIMPQWTSRLTGNKIRKLTVKKTGWFSRSEGRSSG